MSRISDIWTEFAKSLKACTAEADLFNLKAAYLGKEGTLNKILKDLKNLDPGERASLGQEANQLKQRITEALEQRLDEIEHINADTVLKEEKIDVTYRASVRDLGLNHAAYHPLTNIERDVEDLFFSMGFDILDGSYIEDDYHNFSALNIPPEHPARDTQDTFWFKDGVHCLRTQTSPVQIRGMEKYKPPFKFVSLGKVFRNENIDAGHEMAFHQIEAMVVDKDISLGHMMHFLKSLISKTLQSDIEVRLRTSYFPFVEPGFELDIQCRICMGEGCSVCKDLGWVEFCGCGLVHPKVLEEGGIDSTQWSGFAFGIGWDRLAMMRYGINDIRQMHSGDLRFVKQFKSY